MVKASRQAFPFLASEKLYIYCIIQAKHIETQPQSLGFHEKVVYPVQWLLLKGKELPWMSGVENKATSHQSEHSDTWMSFCLERWQYASTHILEFFRLKDPPQPLIFTWIFPILNVIVFSFMSGEYQCWISVQVGTS